MTEEKRTGPRHIQRSTLALMRSQHALKLLEEKTALAEEEASRASVPRTRTAEDRKRRAAESVGSFEGDFVTAFGNMAVAVVRDLDGLRDPILTRAPTGASEGSPTDGGFLVGEQFEGLKDTIYDAREVAPFVDRR